MGVLWLGMAGEGERTGIGKENRKFEERNFILNNYYCQRFSCQNAPKSICRLGSARTPLGSLSAPPDPLAIVVAIGKRTSPHTP
jgi:hypothetical protein